jgi:hypothetical protein
MIIKEVPESKEVLDDLQRSARALSKYKEDFVLVGGLVPLCYRKIFQGDVETIKPILTSDIDWAVPNRIQEKEGQKIITLINKAGYRQILSQHVVPPIAKFQHERFDEKTTAPVTLEFITDRKGGTSSRSGEDLTKVNVQAGFRVVALSHVRILMDRPMTFDLSKVDDLGLKEKLEVQIPHPANYVLQKLLISKRRSTKEKHDKDLAYVYDVAILTRGKWHAIKERLEQIEKAIPSKWMKDARRIVDQGFQDKTSAGPIAISRIYQKTAPQLTEVRVHRVMSDFFMQVGLSLGLSVTLG